MKTRRILALGTFALIGSGLLYFVGWRWNMPLAAWVAPALLIRFARMSERGWHTVLLVPILAVVSIVQLTGGWDIGAGLLIAIGVMRATGLYVPLLLDRLVRGTDDDLRANGIEAGRSGSRVSRWIRPLVFPSALVLTEYLISLLPIGTIFSLAPTQFDSTGLIQMTAVTGPWGITFLIGLAAVLANDIWSALDAGRQRLVPAHVATYAAIIVAVVAAGGVVANNNPHPESTVRTAGITESHVRDYWGEVIDLETPRDLAWTFADETRLLEEKLFAASERAVASGAKIIFWSEGNAVVYPEELDKFSDRAAAFADENDIYFAPAILVFQYGTYANHNSILMFDPDGKLVMDYTKTKSWYPTDSDGVLDTVQTPYGTISGVVCFDLDFPTLVRQAGRAGTDILIVPAFDTKPISPYHTEAGLLRGVENGMAIVRQAHDGTSMAADAYGRVMARQSYFSTDSAVMIVDVPTAGRRTLYRIVGDWLVIASALVLVMAIVAVLTRRRS
jgi:apolipoprotein N-acyltransferase